METQSDSSATRAAIARSDRRRQRAHERRMADAMARPDVQAWFAADSTGFRADCAEAFPLLELPALAARKPALAGRIVEDMRERAQYNSLPRRERERRLAQAATLYPAVMAAPASYGWKDAPLPYWRPSTRRGVVVFKGHLDRKRTYLPERSERRLLQHEWAVRYVAAVLGLPAQTVAQSLARYAALGRLGQGKALHAAIATAYPVRRPEVYRVLTRDGGEWSSVLDGWLYKPARREGGAA